LTRPRLSFISDIAITAFASVSVRLSAVCLLALFLVLAGSPPRPGLAAELDETIEVCTSCHGEEGRPAEPDTPILWGQEFYYLYVQLKDYKAGRRDNELMSGIVAEMSRDEMKALAQYFADKDWPRIGYRTEEVEIARAESATGAGQCVQCHLGGYNGASRVPRLAGQQPDYLVRTMLEFKHKIRLNSPAKGSLFASFGDADIEAMAHYLAGM
jgi:cytochrome c553